MTAVLSIVLAALAGAAWRRWWGAARPSWAFPGYRAMQAVVGCALLGPLCWWATGAAVPTALRVACAIALLASAARCVPAIWDATIWVDEKVGGIPRFGTWFDGPVAYAEALAGAAIWATAVAV